MSKLEKIIVFIMLTLITAAALHLFDRAEHTYKDAYSMEVYNPTTNTTNKFSFYLRDDGVVTHRKY